MSAISVATGTVMDTVKTKIGSEGLKLMGLENSASWEDSFFAAASVNAFEEISGHEMGFFSKMALTQGLSYGLSKFHQGNEGENALSHLGLTGLASSPHLDNHSLFERMGVEKGAKVEKAFNSLFDKIDNYADKFLGEDNVVSNMVEKLGFSRKEDKLSNESKLDKMFSDMDLDSLLMGSDEKESVKKKRNLMTPDFSPKF